MKELRVWTGPMGGSKTTGALHAARRYERLGQKVVLIRPRVSVRAHEQHGMLVTKNGEKYPAKECDDADEILSLAEGAQVIWIDEPFLFTNEARVYEHITTIRKTSLILVSTLGCDAEHKPFFTSAPKILSVADQINWCPADCDCCGDMNAASRHVIHVNYTPGESCPGGEESFSAACPECWTYLQQFPPTERRSHFLRGATKIALTEEFLEWFNKHTN